MATRAFTDSTGMEWLIWHVTPGQHTRRAGRGLSTLPEELADGWLAFECSAGKRRFYPVPPEWETLADDKLEILCRAAIPVVAAKSSAALMQGAPDAGGEVTVG
jgi:hypothetical protein